MLELQQLCNSGTQNLQHFLNDTQEVSIYPRRMAKYRNAELSKTAGARLKKARINKGLTLKELSDLVPGMSFSRLSNYEQGRHMIPVDVAVALANVLEITPEYLLGLTDVVLDEEDLGIVTIYKSLDDAGRQAIKLVLEQMRAAYNVGKRE